jgi:hypothetical protein
MNVLSPVLALPNGIAHFVLLLTSAARDGTEVNVRLAFYQGVYATMLQFYVARRIYLTRPLGRLVKSGRRRSSAGSQS